MAPKKQIVFLHGWAGAYDTYGKVPQLLAKAGYPVEHIHLGEYTTGDDDLSIDDYAIALQKAFVDRRFGKPFDVIVHSTGVLVVRAWLTKFYKPNQTSPVRKLIMVAPANNGSRLAGWGKKVPWDWGNKVLDALGLGASFTWNLNWEWLLSQRHARMPGLEIYHLQGSKNDLSMPKVFDFLDDAFGLDIPVFEEEGSDNTVRVSAANLNMKGMRLAEGQKTQDATIHEISGIPIYHFPDRSHFGDKHGILGSIKSKQNKVYQTIIEVLDCDPGSPPKPTQPFSAKQNFVMLTIRVIDQIGNPFEEFVTRFYFGNRQESKQIKIKHRNENKECDCFYIQYKDLKKVSKFGFFILKNRIGNAEYSQSAYIDLHWPAQGIHFLTERQTHFVQVTVNKTIRDAAFHFKNPE